MRRQFLLLAVAAVALAGCAQTPPGTEESTEMGPPQPEEGDAMVKPFAYPVDSTAHAPGGIEDDSPGYEPGDTPITRVGTNIAVPDGVRRVEVEAAWTCPEARTSCPIRLLLLDPAGEVAAEDVGETRAVVQAEDVQPGDWFAALQPQEQPAGIEGEFRIRFERGDLPPRPGATA